MNETNNKKIWSSNLNIQTASHILKDYLQRSCSKGINISDEPVLYQSYIFNTYWMTNNYTELSKYFKFSKNDTPDLNIARKTLLKLMSVCLTTHALLKPSAVIKYEPYVFTIPNLSNFGMFSYGVIYTIEENNKNYSIVVAEWDIKNCFDAKLIAPWNKLSVIQDSNLCDLEKINKLKDMDQAKYYQINDWKSFKEYKNKVDQIEEKEQFNFGKILNFEPELKEWYNQVGCLWAKGIKSWFIPKGMNFILVEKFFKTKRVK